ncbi:MAG: hypothetical protein AB1505_15080 [Candidatus Latescibacterota bacterium]
MGKTKKAVKEPAQEEAPDAAPAEVAPGDAGSAPRQAPAGAFAVPETVHKPQALAVLFAGFREQSVGAQVLRPRMMSESVEHGRGRTAIRGFVFRKFGEEPRAVLFVTVPRGIGGGSFEPPDRMLAAGEALELSYTMDVPDAGRPIHFNCTAHFLRKSFYVAEDPDKPGKPWVGPREEAVARLPQNLVVAGDDVLELRVDSVLGSPHGPGSLRRDVLGRYLSQARLVVIPGGPVWNQKNAQGRFYEGIRDPLAKLVEREQNKTMESVVLDEFGNLGDMWLVLTERLLADVQHEIARPGLVAKPNDHLREINANIGFLLHFRMDDEVKEGVVRTFPQKAGAEDTVYLPLWLERVTEAKEKYRVLFRVFPRDLVEDRSRHSMDRGLKFQPPYALHQGSGNQICYSKLMIALGRRFHEDEKPEDEKLKSGKLVASVQQRVSEMRHEYVDEKVKAAFQERVAAKKRQDEGA